MQRLIVLFIFVLLTLAGPLFAQPDDDGDIPAIRVESGIMTSDSLDGFDLNTTKPTNPKLTSALDTLYNSWSAGASLDGVIASEPGLQVQGNQVFVMFIMADEASAAQLVTDLPGLNATVTAHYKTWIDAWVPISALGQLTDRTGVGMIRLPGTAVHSDVMTDPGVQVFPVNEPQSGTVLSQGVAVSNADAWQAAGITGADIDIGIIGYFDEYEAAQNAGELPDDVTIFNTLRTISSGGTATGEIIYDMAPDADLTFSSRFTSTEYVQLIVDLAAAGNEVVIGINDFVGLPVPNDGTGVVADAIAEAQNDYGAVFISGAGNNAEVNWVGEYCDCDNPNDVHEFATPDGGWDEINQIINPADPDNNFLSAGQELYVSLRWSDWPTTDQDYDVLLVRWDPTADNGNGAWVREDGLEDVQTGSQPPIEAGELIVPQDGLYGLVVVQFSGNTVHDLQLRAYVPTGIGDSVSGLLPLEYAVPSYSLNTSATSPENFVPTDIEWDTFNLYQGNSQGPALGLGGVVERGFDQPRIADYGGVDTFTFGTENFRSVVGHPAGAVALVMEAYPDFTPQQVKSFLEDRAIDLGDNGYDLLYGAGRLFLGDPPGGTATETPTPETETPTPVTETPTPVTETPTPEPGCVGEQTICRISPRDDTVMATGAQYVSRYSWEALPEADWYHVQIVQRSTDTIAFNRWYPADQVCNSEGICSIRADVWVVGTGIFDWWMTYWNPDVQDTFQDLYESSQFNITMPLPGAPTVVSPDGVVPSGGGTVTGLELEWEPGSNALWYQVWVGTADFSRQIYRNWENAAEICEPGGTCAIVIPSQFTFPPR